MISKANLTTWHSLWLSVGQTIWATMGSWILTLSTGHLFWRLPCFPSTNPPLPFSSSSLFIMTKGAIHCMLLKYGPQQCCWLQNEAETPGLLGFNQSLQLSDRLPVSKSTASASHSPHRRQHGVQPTQLHKLWRPPPPQAYQLCAIITHTEGS